MNKCKKCNVVILDDTDRCPLCKHVLESDGIPGESRYPDAIATARKFRFVENLVLFISIVAECLLIAINFHVDREVAWSLVIGIILLYGNVVLRMAILGKSGYLAKTVCLVLLAIVMLLGIDYLTGYSGKYRTKPAFGLTDRYSSVLTNDNTFVIGNSADNPGRKKCCNIII